MRTTLKFGSRKTRFALTGLAIAGLFAIPGAVASASTSGQSHDRASSAVKPTIVLEHGAWADNSSWNAVVERLQGLGYTVDTAPNPLRGVQTDSTYLSDFLSTVSGPVVLVGHSYGGFVITNAATGNPQVKALVYDDAYIPAPGDTTQSLTGDKPGSCLAVDPTTVFNLVPYPNSPSGDANLYVKPSVFPGCFANGLPASEGAALAAEQQPVAASALKEQLIAAPAWKTIPSWDVVGTNDHVIPSAEQLAMAQRAGSHVTEINAPHLSMISDPGAVTQVILEAAHAAS